jgi:predicted transcriptional regulator
MTVLTLQYPDAYEGRLRILASTHDKSVLMVFKKTVLEEAKLRTLGLIDDEVLRRDAEFEYERLRSLLDMVIPEGAEGA